MEKKYIYGIQQIGIGVENIIEAYNWYAANLGSDISVFDDGNVATHMAKYMGGEPHKKRAILALNMQGGGGYEFWQYLDRKPSAPSGPIQIGDLGINFLQIKTRDVQKLRRSHCGPIGIRRSRRRPRKKIDLSEHGARG